MLMANRPHLHPLFLIVLQILDLALQHFDFLLKIGKIGLLVGDFSNGDVENVFIKVKILILQPHHI
jgi:hypothetical protein